MTLKLIDTTSGAGETIKSGGDKINGNFAQAGTRLGRFSPVYCLFDGDSKGGEIRTGLQWMAAFEGLDINTSSATLNVGGSNSGTGAGNLLDPARLATATAALTAHSAANHVVDYFLTIGTNDTSANVVPTVTMANVRKFHEQYLRTQSCFRYLVLVGVDPRVGSAASVSQIHTINRLYEAYAAANPFDVIFLDPTGVLVDPAAGNLYGNPIPFGTTAAPMPLGAVTDDGLHCSSFGQYLKRFVVHPLRDTYRKKPQRSLVRSLTNTSPTGLNANILGDGRTVAIGGTEGITKGGTAAVTGTPPLNWTSSGSLNGSLSAAWSASTVTIATDGGLIPRGVWPCVRLTFSGTTGASVNNIQLQTVGYPDTGIVAGDVVTAGGLLNFNALQGLLGLGIATNSPGAIRGTSVGANNVNVSPLAQTIAQTLAGPMLLEGERIPATDAQGGFFFSLNIYFAPNTAVSGSIDILVLFAERVGPVPAATA